MMVLPRGHYPLRRDYKSGEEKESPGRTPEKPAESDAANDLTRRFQNNELTGTAPAASDRVRPKGELSRHRTIVEDSAPEDQQAASENNSDTAARRSIDLSVCVRGRVVKVHGLISMVRSEDGRNHACHVRRLLKSLEIEGRSVITVGDWVWFRPGHRPGPMASSRKLRSRRGVITRGYRHRQHIIAANVDQVLIVSAFDEPGVKLNLIDRYLVSGGSRRRASCRRVEQG